ncbi:MAG: hypothetical protein NC182_04580 [Prevotella sp.]|nr:hypothetical protein [Staphylococcus sp.]MCM1350459.1 hypothetical protein [Prevotella sp.]
MNNTHFIQEEIEVISTANQTLRQSYFRYEKKMNIFNFSMFMCCFVTMALVGMLLSSKIMTGISVGITLFLLLMLVIVLVNIHKRSKLSCDVSYDEFLFQSDAFIVKEKSVSNSSTTKILYTQVVGLTENKDFFLIQLKDNRGYLIEVSGNELALWKIKRMLFPYVKIFNQITVTKKTKIESCEYMDNALRLSPGMITVLNGLLTFASLIVGMFCVYIDQQTLSPLMLFPVVLVLQLSIIGLGIFLGTKSGQFKKSILAIIVGSILFFAELMIGLSYVILNYW